jgi:inhibitor of KinA sporulation pathway (predicted exonuclease)
MNILSLDCEYNQPSHKTIQIGVAIFKARTGQLIEKFETYVCPGEPISQGGNGIVNITELTGIKDSDVSGAPTILEAYEMVKNLHVKHKCFKNPLVWGSGVRNDSQLIYQEAYPSEELRKENPNFMGYRVIDVKGTFQSIQIFHNKTVRGGLQKTCETLGIGFEGQAHTALADAINTFRVWHFLIKEFPKGFK